MKGRNRRTCGGYLCVLVFKLVGQRARLHPFVCVSAHICMLSVKRFIFRVYNDSITFIWCLEIKQHESRVIADASLYVNEACLMLAQVGRSGC